MDSPQPAPMILDTLRTVEFRLGLKGYNVDEVDEYLEKAAVEAESLHEQLRQLNDRLRQASERIAELESERQSLPPAAAAQAQPAAAASIAAEPMADETLQRTLVMAQRFVDQAMRESESQASEIVAQAEERARVTLSQAEEQARQLMNDAERDLRDEVSRLETSRAKLVADVENMARHLDAERSRLRGALTEVLKWVDENVQPATSLLGQRPRPASSERPAPASATPSAATPSTGEQPASRPNPAATPSAGDQPAPRPNPAVAPTAPVPTSSNGDREQPIDPPTQVLSFPAQAGDPRSPGGRS